MYMFSGFEVKYSGSVLSQSRVYYVTAVSDDNSYLMRLINVLDKDETRTHITLIIVLMDKVHNIIIAHYTTNYLQ